MGANTETLEFHYAGSNETITPLLIAFIVILILRYGIRYLVFRAKLRAIKKRNVVVTQFEAPPDISPALFGAIIDNRPSSSDMAATFLYLHLNGYVMIRYDNTKADVHITRTATAMLQDALEHEYYMYTLVDSSSGIWGSQLKDKTMDIANNFSFLLQRDLQRAGYYHFNKHMENMSYVQYYFRIIGHGLIKGLIKPWNWPGFFLSFAFPGFAITWVVLSLLFYSRLGLYNYRTPKWEEKWPELAGYYNYLRVVEAGKRAFEVKDIARFNIGQHDPYLAAAMLQSTWGKLLTNSIEQGSRDYDTI